MSGIDIFINIVLPILLGVFGLAFVALGVYLANKMHKVDKYNNDK